jgi:magnesium transporter
MICGSLASEQVSLFLGDGYVITFDEKPGDSFDPIRERIRQGKGKIRQVGADYLAYALLDAIIDRHFPLLEHYDSLLDELEDEIMEHPTKNTIMKIHEIRRDLLVIKRILWPMRDVISALLRESASYIRTETIVFLRDCYDHTIRAIDLVENYREIVTSLMDVYLSSVSNRLNDIMKVLTMIATIFIPLSFIAGIYGMNFNTQKSPLNMPELDWYWGYPFALAVMAAVAAGIVFYYWRKGWIFSGRAKESTVADATAALSKCAIEK